MNSTGREASTMSGFSFSTNSSTSSSSFSSPSQFSVVTSSSSTTTATGSVPIFANPATGAASTGTSTSFLGLQTSFKTVAATTPASSLFGCLTHEPQPAETSPPLAATKTPQKKLMVFRVVVPVLKIESFTGRNGDLIKKMCQETKAHICVLEGSVCDTDRIVLISGNEEIEAPLSPAMDAVIRVFKRVHGLPETESDGLASIPFCSVRLLVPSMQATSLIEKQGSLINKIQVLNTGCSVRILSSDEVSASSVNSDDRVVDLHGTAFKVLQALEAVLGHLRKFLVDHSLLPLFEKTTGNDRDFFGRRPGFFLTGQPPILRIKSRRRLGAAIATSTLESLPPHITANPSGMERIAESKRSRVSWENIHVVKTFLDACIHEVTINGREDGSLKAMSWKKVGEILKDRHNFSVDDKQMKNYFNDLKSKYKARLIPKNKIYNIYNPSSKNEMKKNNIETLRNAFLPFPDLCAQLFDGTKSMGILSWGMTPAKPVPTIEPLMVEDDEDTAIRKDTLSFVSPSTSHPPVKNKQIFGKQVMSVFEEEILGVLRMIADKMNKPQPPPKPTFEDCEKKLNELGWAKDYPLHLVALTIFCDENDKYRECWVKLNPEKCANWVRTVGRSKRFI